MNKNIESLHDDVFGKTFAMYDKAEMERFIKPFKVRFERNGINPIELFKGKRILDAGCGGGRGSLFMAMHGAKEIIALDVSPLNVESTKRNAELFGFSNIISAQKSSLESIAFPNGDFDFVWCNGVLMHTHNPDACLQELARVLKPNGSSWIYVYGAGGVYWYLIYKFREMLGDFPELACIHAMKLAQIPVQFLAEYMDDWKAPYLRTYTDKDFSTRLSELGFVNVSPLPYGMDYDTSHRIQTFPGDTIFLGEGDLRYLVLKKNEKVFYGEQGHPISDSERGSNYDYSKVYTEVIDSKFYQVYKICSGSLMLKILSFAYIQRHLRDTTFASSSPFSLDDFVKWFDELIELLSFEGSKEK